MIDFTIASTSSNNRAPRYMDWLKETPVLTSLEPRHSRATLRSSFENAQARRTFGLGSAAGSVLALSCLSQRKR
jgi:hypothetical protein